MDGDKFYFKRVVVSHSKVYPKACEQSSFGFNSITRQNETEKHEKVLIKTRRKE